jgi:hypothetical protein
LPLLFAVVGAVGALAGLFGTIVSSIRHSRAGRRLQSVLERNSAQRVKLESITKDLERDPDPSKVEEARQIVVSLTQSLDASDRSDIRKTLDRGSNQSRANYITKLVDDDPRRNS